MARVVSEQKQQVHKQRAERLNRAAETRAALLEDDDIDADEPTRERGRKLKLDELGISDDKEQVIVGLNPQGRRVITWPVGITNKSLLIAGYGVPHTSYLLQAIIGHYKHHGVLVYGIDNMDLLAGYPKGTFAQLLSHRRNEGVELLTSLVGNESEKVVVLTQLGVFLNPAHSNLSDAAATNTREEILSALHALVQDEHTHVIITTSKLLREADLPDELIHEFDARVIVGRIFANEAPRLISEEEKTLLDKASIMQSLLQVPGGAEIFQHARPGLLRNY